jgi:hypothetical protein
MTLENPLKKQREGATNQQVNQTEDSVDKNLSGVYRIEEDEGEKKRHEPLQLPETKTRKKRVALQEKKHVAKQRGPYDGPKPDPVKFQEDLDKRFP